MNRVTHLVRTDVVSLERFDHVPGVAHRDPERERAPGHAVNFVESGSFQVRTTGVWHDVSCDRLFVTTPGLEFSCAHADDHPVDCCLSVSYSEDAVESARSVVAVDDAPGARRVPARSGSGRHRDLLRRGVRVSQPLRDGVPQAVRYAAVPRPALSRKAHREGSSARLGLRFARHPRVERGLRPGRQRPAGPRIHERIARRAGSDAEP
jgi:hypothetical protein